MAITQITFHGEIAAAGTFVREHGNVHGALFSDEVRNCLENVFLLSRENKWLCIERLDKWFQDTFSKRVPRLDEPLRQRVHGGVDGSADHVDARRHDAARLGVAEADDSPDPLSFFRLQDAFARADVDESLDLLIGSLAFLILLVYRLNEWRR